MRKFDSYILNATITKEAGRYYVSVCAREEVINEEVNTKTILGLDLGVKTLITTINGEKY